MTTKEKIHQINLYVESVFARHGLSGFGTIDVNVKFTLNNYNDNFSNAFPVESEDEAKEILKEFITVPFSDDIFKDSIYDTTKQLFLHLELQMPT